MCDHAKGKRYDLADLAGDRVIACRVLRDGANAQEVLPKPVPPFKEDREHAQGFEGRLPKPVRPRPRRTCSSSSSTTGSATRGCVWRRGGAPTMDRLAREGLRYSTFHHGACSPTWPRSSPGATTTAGTGVIIELGTGFPGYGNRSELDGRTSRDPASERLRHRGLRQVAQHARQ
jgi:hypothetical protein